VTVDLFLVLLFKTKNNLGGYDALVREFDVQIGVESERGGVFEQMCFDFLLIDTSFHVVAWLIYAKESEAVESPGMNFLSAIGHYADNDLLYSQCGGFVTLLPLITFSHALGPQVREFFLVHRCEIFRITPYIVLQNKTSSSCKSRKLEKAWEFRKQLHQHYTWL